MRLFLILCLLAASVFMGPPGSAQAHDQHALQVQMMNGHHHDGAPDQGGDNGKAHAVAHVCPGCALVAQTFVAASAFDIRALPKLPANPPSLKAFHSNPIPPPPRES